MAQRGAQTMNDKNAYFIMGSFYQFLGNKREDKKGQENHRVHGPLDESDLTGSQSHHGG